MAARGAALSVEREPKHLLLHGGQKLADLLIQNFLKGFHASAFNVFVFDTQQSTSLHSATVDTGYVAQAAHDRKARKYREACLEVNLDFFPMVWKSTGGATSTVHFMVESWFNQEADRCGLPRATIQARLYQRLSLTLQRELARMVMKRMSTQDLSWVL